MNRRVIAVAMALGSAGVGCSVLEPREAKVEGNDQCALLNPYRTARPEAPRFYRYRTHVNLGEPLPRSVSTRGGAGATQTWIGRANRTRRAETDFNPRLLLVVLQYVLLAVAAFVALVAFSPSRGEDDRSRRLRNVIIAASALVLSLASGYFGGSVVTVDNASNQPLDVELNGANYALPPQSHMNLRADGFFWDVDARLGGQTVESLRLYPDEGPGDALIRLIFGHGRFVYTVCGLNRYTLQQAHYGRR